MALRILPRALQCGGGQATITKAGPTTTITTTATTTTHSIVAVATGARYQQLTTLSLRHSSGPIDVPSIRQQERLWQRQQMRRKLALIAGASGHNNCASYVNVNIMVNLNATGAYKSAGSSKSTATTPVSFSSTAATITNSTCAAEDNAATTAAAAADTTESTVTKISSTSAATTTTNPPRDWCGILNAAEQITGSPTSVVSLQSIVGEEAAGLAVYAKRLAGSQHPMVKAVRSIVLGSESGEKQLRGLVVLLLSKTLSAGALASSEPISAKQRALAEITELIHSATTIHSGILDLSGHEAASEAAGTVESEAEAAGKGDLLLGNKMAVLGGDFLLASACTALSRLHNCEVVGAMSSAIADTAEGEFLSVQSATEEKGDGDDLICHHLATAAGAVEHWTVVAEKRSAALFAQSCRSAALLGEQDAETAKRAHAFGRQLGLAHQLSLELGWFAAWTPAAAAAAAADTDDGGSSAATAAASAAAGGASAASAAVHDSSSEAPSMTTTTKSSVPPAEGLLPGSLPVLLAYAHQQDQGIPSGGISLGPLIATFNGGEQYAGLNNVDVGGVEVETDKVHGGDGAPTDPYETNGGGGDGGGGGGGKNHMNGMTPAVAEQFWHAVSATPALEDAREARRRHHAEASRILGTFPDGDARSALQSIVDAVLLFPS
eukprot:UC1_evm2s1202